ncbi:NADH:ubiquinone reductase (Na(+)-transporting) subunit C [Plebeiibacterium sediminum]|uniref:Na(+)-translocating NADH-quinone reductase subunit C n=1 Tax=Plebeiibacterium sediminum TaxID=2992112 RepID=A0AAE3SFR7_9BACT|nr:NADH:ubiquinone reductase (Na(+)-transporting) subunit C [Plebeiobacterium sediminum]MCW3787546.1 NADH:ubiquinone reductase (Na(+)-transporting) subunit C [Plebeiobacterium sediminum]
MDKQGNTYTFLYASIMVIGVAAILAFISVSLKPIQSKNVAVAKKIDILKSVGIASDASTAEKLYEEHIGSNTKVLNIEGNEVDGNAFDIDLSKEVRKDLKERSYPLYICKLDNGEEKLIIPLRGAGLWGPIWGYISLNADRNTVYGATFDHKGETPGLGAEISKDFFQTPFKGKTIYNEAGDFTSIDVVKGGGTENNPHAVDAISGGTITSKGVSAMLQDCLSGYEKYLKN